MGRQLDRSGSTHTQKASASLPHMSAGPPLMPLASRGACLLVD
eukprot:COSAG01_NODE_31170_length_602_cov_2.252485_1_plen_42_part_10